MPPEAKSEDGNLPPPSKPPGVIAKWVAGVLSVSGGAATVYGLFTDKRIAILAFIGMVFAMVLLFVIARAAKAITQNKPSPFYDFLVKALVLFVALYFIVLSSALFRPLYHFLTQAPPIQTPSSQVQIAQLLSSMTQNLNAEQYNEAEIRADQILKLDSNNFDAFNAKGSIDYYRGEYAQAIKFFNIALKMAPDTNDALIRENLADSHVENGDYQEAIQEYLGLNDTGNVEWKFRLARAYLYADDYDKCLDYIQEIPTKVFGGHPRIIQAAALSGLLETTPETGKAKVLKQIKQNLIEGRNADPAYWDAIFSGKKDIRIGYSKVLELVGSAYKALQHEKIDLSNIRRLPQGGVS